ncbi:MAG: helix-turn-helix domain-containing protein [Terrimesophilobacter sp.]
MALDDTMATHQTATRRTLASLSRINLLHELQEHGTRTITELAEATGLHHNTAREHLHRLIGAGLVASEPIPVDQKGRPKLRYRATTGGAVPHTGQASSIRSPADEQLDTLGDHMSQCGFDAVIEADRQHMVMHDCPFAALAHAHPQVCAVHFALVKGSLESTVGPVRARRLHPFFTQDDCIVDLESDADPGPAR